MPHQTMDGKTRESYESQSLQIRAELKKWEGDWALTSGGKKPGRDDIKQNADIGTLTSSVCTSDCSLHAMLPFLTSCEQPRNTNSTINFGTYSQARSRCHRHPPKPQTGITSSANAHNPMPPSHHRHPPSGPGQHKHRARHTIPRPPPRPPRHAPPEQPPP